MNAPKTVDEMTLTPAPVLDVSKFPTIPWESDLPRPPKNKWEQEYQAFLRMRPALLKTHRDQYVAIHGGQVVETGNDLVTVASRAYSRYGRVPMYIDQVTEQRRVERIPSPRRVPKEALP